MSNVGRPESSMRQLVLLVARGCIVLEYVRQAVVAGAEVKKTEMIYIDVSRSGRKEMALSEVQ